MFSGSWVGPVFFVAFWVWPCFLVVFGCCLILFWYCSDTFLLGGLVCACILSADMFVWMRAHSYKENSLWRWTCVPMSHLSGGVDQRARVFQCRVLARAKHDLDLNCAGLSRLGRSSVFPFSDCGAFRDVDLIGALILPYLIA